ncbi:MAG: hypothetical protein KAW09_06665, partial [Thermoplasmata archaeon]|nr:hypothetical protein [Thermoplasmata archaeon]
GKNLTSEIKGYMVGGGAMSLRGDKEATKDVDVVFSSRSEATEFISALRRCSFRRKRDLPEVYGLMDTYAVMRAEDLFWFDIFVKRVCRKFYLSEGVKERADEWGTLGKFRLYLCSREDIFLSKSITDRDSDLEDMAVLYRRMLDFDTILKECEIQTENSEMIWHLYLAEKIDEMELAQKLIVPWKEEFRERGGRILLEKFVPQYIAKGENTVARMTSISDVEEKLVRNVLSDLEERGIIEANRKTRPYIYYLPDS